MFNLNQFRKRIPPCGLSLYFLVLHSSGRRNTVLGSLVLVNKGLPKNLIPRRLDCEGP